jgi:hypothetical protein
VGGVAKMMIRLDSVVSDELASAFPHLTPRHHGASTTLTGQVTDQEELQGVLNLLSSLGIEVVEVVTIPED